MSAAALAFRFRIFLFVLLYVLGFLPPWDFSSGSHSTFWLGASTLLARSGWISLATATLAVTLVALVCLAAGALLRVWGTAYLGSGVMRDSALHGEGLVAAGPYRHLRNPLYLGSWLLALGASILMPLDGALFFLPAFSVFVLLLITTEERFLVAKLGNTYRQYLRLVPRLLPNCSRRTQRALLLQPRVRCGCRRFWPRLIQLPSRSASRCLPGATTRAS